MNGLFNFKHDSETNPDEFALRISLAINNGVESNSDSDESDVDSVDLDDLEDELEELEETLSDLEDMLSDIDDREPENNALEFYERWKRRKELLESLILEIDRHISEVSDLIAEQE